MSDLIVSENLYLLYGDVPAERMFTIDGIFHVRDEAENLENDLRSRLYSKSKCGNDSFTIGSVNETMDSNDVYFFGYSNQENDEFSKSFIDLRIFLANARFIGRKFVPNKESAYESFQGAAISSLEVEMIENDETSYELVCALGNVAIIKVPSVLFSGYKIVSITQTPLVGKEYEFVASDIKNYDVEDIIEGIKSDLNGDDLPFIDINSNLDIDDSISINPKF